ncbi:fused endonuclease-methyltransferase [groundwater metagenome]
MDNEAANRIRQEIEKLVKSYSDLRKFKNDKEIAAISEANVRADYIDRLFGILGWNTSNPDEYDREHFIRGAGFADVALILNKKPVIFIEAKRFGGIAHSRDIKGDWTLEERQSILYAVSKNCKWAILTNFEKFRVFNALTGLTILNFESVFDYKDRFNDLLYLTKDYVESGRIEKLGAREEKQDIDLEFLDLLNKWRIELANDIYRNNFLNEGKPPDLSKLFPNYEKYEKDPKMAKFFESRREILRKRLDFSVLKDEKGNFDIERLKSAVQRILDRLIIIRWAEDRLLLDDPNILEGKLKLWKMAARYNPLYEALFADGALFDKFNDIHNGELFKRGLFYDRVTVSDGVLARIIEEMTLHSFRKFDFDILGNTYETYLGNTLYLKEDNTFELRPSQETRKESGIYYTPPYVVDYIVKNTLGALLKDKKPEEVARIKVLDPACGSGSFLIKAYDCFANYYEERNREIEARIAEMLKTGKITENFEGKHSGYEASILLNNIHGVDLDSQAAEIAAVNLMLKALKAEEMLPPILGETIKVGNSLISGSEDELKKYFREEWRAKKPFEWTLQFNDVFDCSNGSDGGFDIIIGNPPYGIVFKEADKHFFEDKYPTFKRNNDIYVAFIEKGISLLRKDGLFSFIVPNTYLTGPYFNDLKEYILNSCKILKILDFGINMVFNDPNVFTSIIILQKERDEKSRKENLAEHIDIIGDGRLIDKNFIIVKKKQCELKDHWKPLSPIVEKVSKIEPKLGDIAFIKDVGLNYWTKGRGKKRGDSIGSRVLYEGAQKHEKDIPYLKGRNINRYFSQFGNNWLKYDYEAYLDPEVDIFRFSAEFLERNEKIIYRQTSDKIIATIDYQKYYLDKTVHLIVLNEDYEKKFTLKYILAILNSKLASYFYQDIAKETGRTFAQVMTFNMKKIPIFPIDISIPSDKAINDEFASLVDRMLSLNKQLNEINADFRHYLNLRPHSMVLLRNFMDALPVGDKEVLKDAFGRKPVSAIKTEKFEAFEILEEGEWLVFKVAYLYKSSKGKIERGSITRALRLHIPDNIMRKFILYNLKDTTPGKLGMGNILEQLQKLKIPRLVTNGEDNRRAIEELMAPFLIEIAKKGAIEQEIRATDDAINKKVYSVYGLTTDEIKIIEENR